MASRAPLILGGIACVIGIAAWGLLGSVDAPEEPIGLELTAPSAIDQPPATGQQPSRLPVLQNGPDLAAPANRTEIPNGTPSSASLRPPGPGEARISGWVKLALRPVEGATISARTPSGSALASAISQPDGSWALFLEPETSFVLRASYPMTVAVERVEPAMAEGDQRRAGNLTLAMARRFTGAVHDSADQPIPGAWAAVAGAPATELALADSVHSTGNLILEGAPLGAVIEVGAPGFVTQFIRPFTDDVGSTLDVTLKPGRRVEVLVQDATGQPVAGATVLFVEGERPGRPPAPYAPKLLGRAPQSNSSAARHSIQTNANGLGSASTLDPGEYWAEASHPDFDASAPAAIPNANFSDTGDGRPTITLAFRPRVQFQVVDKQTGVPVPRVVVACRAEANQSTSISCAYQAGAVDEPTTVEGVHTAYAWAPGYQVGTLEVTATRGPARAKTSGTDSADLPQLALTKSEFQQLRVVDEAGNSVPGATVFFRMETASKTLGQLEPWAIDEQGDRSRTKGDRLGDGWNLATQDATGPVQIQVPGTLDWPVLVVRAPNFQTQTITRDNWPAASDSGELTVTLYQSTEALITVVDALGKPALGAQIYVTLQGKAMPTPFRTDSRGQALIQGLSTGSASAMARGPAGNLTARIQFELKTERKAELTLTLR
ncbi:MAG: hypothetical protein ACI9D0_001790 [Bacteroidia bacterium]